MLLTLLLMFPPTAGPAVVDARTRNPGQPQTPQMPLGSEPDELLFDFPITRGVGLSVEEILRPEQTLSGFFISIPMNH